MTLSSGPNVVTNGLVLYVDAANPRSYQGSGPALNDLSSNLLSFSVSGSLSYSTFNCGYLVFTGTQSATASTTRSYANSSGLTVSAWININPGGTKCVISHNSNTSTDDGLRLMVQNNQLSLSLGGVGDYTSGIQITDGKWKHLTITSTATSLAFYVNGSQVSEFHPMGAMIGTPSSFTIGDDPVGHGMVGLLSSVSVYRRILQESEIVQNFNALRGRYNV